MSAAQYGVLAADAAVWGLERSWMRRQTWVKRTPGRSDMAYQRGGLSRKMEPMDLKVSASQYRLRSIGASRGMGGLFPASCALSED